MIQLHQYQSEAINDMRQSFAKGNKRLLLVMPTGSGKTITFTHLVHLAYQKGKRILILTDRTELFKQTNKAFSNVLMPVEHIHRSVKNISPQARVFLGMVETVKRRLPTLKPMINPDLIICDEAHKKTFNAIFEAYPDAMAIGATATPVGNHLYNYYQDLINPIDTPELINRGFLCPVRAFQAVDSFDDLKTKAGEFTDSSLYSHFSKPKRYSGVIEQLQRLGKNCKRIIVFNCNVKHSDEMAEQFKQAGYTSESLTSLTPDVERLRILHAFETGLIQVLNNCGILTTGYDNPKIDCVIMNRATMSLPLWLQCAGRGGRTAEGKSEFLLLDFGGNHDRHGQWDSPRTWKLEPEKKRNKNTVAPVKSCPSCDAILHTSLRVCKYCGYQYPEQVTDLPQATMIEVQPFAGMRVSDLSVNELIKLEESKKYKSTYIWRVIRSKGHEALKEYASLKGYKSGWVKRQIDMDSNYKQLLNKINENIVF